MMWRVALLLLLCRPPTAGAAALRLAAGRDMVINRANLIRLKAFILQRGKTCTYSQMFNNNPCLETLHFHFYLNPDPGGPHRHPQWNIGCDPRLGDFHTLVVRRKLRPSTTAAEFRDQYRQLRFASATWIEMELGSEAQVPLSRGWELPRTALREALQAIAKLKPAPR